MCLLPSTITKCLYSISNLNIHIKAEVSIWIISGFYPNTNFILSAFLVFMLIFENISKLA